MNIDTMRVLMKTLSDLQAELVVHKKKIEEVENWIKAHVDPKTFKVRIC